MTRPVRSLLTALGLLFSAIIGQIAAAAPPNGYLDHAGVSKAVQELAASHPASCAADVIGSSRQGRGLHLLVLSSDLSKAHERPALLIVAGADPRHRVGTETALRVARRLLENHAALLEKTTVYIIPSLNPDGAEHDGGAVNLGHHLTMRVVDDDRDGATDEDPPRDINGDGRVTMMRRLDPPLDDMATHLADPVAPRMLKKPSPEKGERAIYSVYTEGLDADGDGRVAEDGPGGVDLERNFMHRWPEHELRAGPTQLSEPESAALAKFIIDHRNIVVALMYGRHDNVINTPDGKGRDASGQAPKDLDEGDVEWYKELSKAFKDITSQQRAPSEDTAGSLHGWLYAQRGIPSFATVVWGRPDASKPAAAAAAETQPATAPQTQPATQPQTQPAATQTAPDAAKKDEKKKEEPKPADAEAAAWLEYSDRDRNKEGFVEWQPFDHPTLGKVEIGGFAPGFQMNPPADQLEGLADKQALFAVELIKKRPDLVLQGPTVKKLAPGLYEVRFGVVNEGYLPTATSMARKARSVMPTVIRLDVPIEQIIAGDRVNKSWGIGGSGERLAQRWIVRLADGATARIELTNPQLGNQTITFTAADSPQTQPATQTRPG